MARLRSAPVARLSPAVPATQTVRPALKEKTNTTRTRAPVYEDDGNTDGLIKDARPRRGRQKKVIQGEDEHVMAGGLGASSGDKTSDRSALPPTTDELVKSDGTAPLIMGATGKRPTRTRRKVLQSEVQSKIMAGVKQRMQATLKKAPTHEGDGEHTIPSADSLPTNQPPRRSKGAALDQSEISLSSSPQPPNRLNSASRQWSSILQPGSAVRLHGTPAIESSILALKNFKRRPRQPSMLQMVQQRTESARPSAVHVPTSEDPDVFDIEDEDDVEDFEPDAEGTPLIASRKRQAVLGSAKTRASEKPRDDSSALPAVTSMKKRKSQDADLSSTSAMEALRLKRRKSNPEDPRADPEKQSSVPVSSPQLRQSIPVDLEDVEADVQVVNSSPTSPHLEGPDSSNSTRHVDNEEHVVPSTEQGQEAMHSSAPASPRDSEENFDHDGTMAEPLSSSPLVEGSTQRTDIMADPLTQVTPPRLQRDKKTKKRAVPMTTATLQSLLPKRRQPLKPRTRKSEYDINSESDDDSPLGASDLRDDEDELGGKLRRQTKSATKKPKSTKPKSAPTKTKHPPSKAASTTRKSQTAAKTYGRASAASDKENNSDADAFEDLEEADESVLPDTSISMYEAARSKELEAAKRKFARVDEWDMEFESVSFEEGRSEGVTWR